MLIAIPDDAIAHTGANTTVTVALLVVAECPHGHRLTLNIPDYDDLDNVTTQAAEWAEEHANNCPGVSAATLRAA